MRGGMKTYRDSPAAARHYVEADRGRADDYYLAEGTGVAQRYVAAPGTGVRPLPALDGDGYEAWVAGVDQETGEPKGRLRHDDRAVRFVEVVVNGPKSWSLAAELHPDISAAYDVAQERAATQIIGWLAQHATTRVGPRGGQVQVPVAQIEAVTVKHYTSRAGDPHRHLHLQINARVHADGAWRGLHTVGVRDSLGAINGIGHAAVMTDPGFRHALAAHGFTLDPGTGEVTQLAGYVGAFSARAAQISRSVQRYETDWRTTHPGQEPGPGLRRGWDARAWADGRPDKVIPGDGAVLTRRWVGELRALGYRDQPGPVPVTAVPVGGLDRDAAVGEVLARLGARRSGWNAADVRGEVELLLARTGVVTDAGVRGELAEDLTARGVRGCVPLLDRPGVPEHVRALTSRHVLEVEADLARRFATRAEPVDARPAAPAAASNTASDRVRVMVGLDPGQRGAVALLTGRRGLVVIEGAAGSGKTTMLAATRSVLAGQGRGVMVVTPTLKAAKAARAQVGARAGSAAWLAYQHGWRWDDAGTWTRLGPGDTDPSTGIPYLGPQDRARLGAGDLLVVDEAGMLDQDTARALVMIADEQRLRVGLLGDRAQLPAVGRGGVLDLAVRRVEPQACLSMDVVHRFTRPDPDSSSTSPPMVADVEYAELSLVMRTGDDAGDVFDALHRRGQIQIHASEDHQLAAIAGVAAGAITAEASGPAAPGPMAVVADTGEQVAALNAAIRDRLIAAGRVQDQRVVTTTNGQRVGVGDRVATRRNDRDLDVANRDTWTVRAVAGDGALVVSNPHVGQRVLPAGYVGEYVELAYASTVHGVQGATTDTAHLVIGEHTDAAAAYVGMTRGRTANTAHLVAPDLETAREQWVQVFARDRADLGPEHARQHAEREVERYGVAATGAQIRPLPRVQAQLRHAWDEQAAAARVVARLRPVLERALVAAPRVAADQQTRTAASQHLQRARQADEQARARVSTCERAVSAAAARIHAQTRKAWDTQRPEAAADARRVIQGTGRFGRGRDEVEAADTRLQDWARVWEPILREFPQHPDGVIGFAAQHPSHDHVDPLLRGYARDQTLAAHPEHAALAAAAEDAHRHVRAAAAQVRSVEQDIARRAQRGDHLADPDSIDRVRRELRRGEQRLTDIQQKLDALGAEPAVTSQPDPTGWLSTQHDHWRDEQHTHRRVAAATEQDGQRAGQHRLAREHALRRTPPHQPGPRI